MGWSPTLDLPSKILEVEIKNRKSSLTFISLTLHQSDLLLLPTADLIFIFLVNFFFLQDHRTQLRGTLKFHLAITLTNLILDSKLFKTALSIDSEMKRDPTSLALTCSSTASPTQRLNTWKFIMPVRLLNLVDIQFISITHMINLTHTCVDWVFGRLSIVPWHFMRSTTACLKIMSLTTIWDMLTSWKTVLRLEMSSDTILRLWPRIVLFEMIDQN